MCWLVWVVPISKKANRSACCVIVHHSICTPIALSECWTHARRNTRPSPITKFAMMCYRSEMFTHGIHYGCVRISLWLWHFIVQYQRGGVVAASTNSWANTHALHAAIIIDNECQPYNNWVCAICLQHDTNRKCNTFTWLSCSSQTKRMRYQACEMMTNIMSILLLRSYRIWGVHRCVTQRVCCFSFILKPYSRLANTHNRIYLWSNIFLWLYVNIDYILNSQLLECKCNSSIHVCSIRVIFHSALARHRTRITVYHVQWR